ncbi:hypothetical protein G6F62_015796 [Rhizopus arrhizus]|nr:hypothetical protein G6F62_015796 [Rhizopus arrhizus]
MQRRSATAHRTPVATIASGAAPAMPAPHLPARTPRRWRAPTAPAAPPAWQSPLPALHAIAPARCTTPA